MVPLKGPSLPPRRSGRAGSSAASNAASEAKHSHREDVGDPAAPLGSVPAALSQQLSALAASPALRQLIDDPQILTSVTERDPNLARLLDSAPGMRALLAPEKLRQALQLAADPHAVLSLLQSTGMSDLAAQQPVRARRNRPWFDSHSRPLGTPCALPRSPAASAPLGCRLCSPRHGNSPCPQRQLTFRFLHTISLTPQMAQQLQATGAVPSDPSAVAAAPSLSGMGDRFAAAARAQERLAQLRSLQGGLPGLARGVPLRPPHPPAPFFAPPGGPGPSGASSSASADPHSHDSCDGNGGGGYSFTHSERLMRVDQLPAEAQDALWRAAGGTGPPPSSLARHGPADSAAGPHGPLPSSQPSCSHVQHGAAAAPHSHAPGPHGGPSLQPNGAHVHGPSPASGQCHADGGLRNPYAAWPHGSHAAGPAAGGPHSQGCCPAVRAAG
jgi:hypothetical protein